MDTIFPLCSEYFIYLAQYPKIQFSDLNAVLEWFRKNGRVSVSRRVKKIQLLSRHTKNLIPSQAHKRAPKKSYKTNFMLKKYDFHSPKGASNYILRRMKPLWVEENNSDDTFECDDDANRVVLYTSSQFFWGKKNQF